MSYIAKTWKGSESRDMFKWRHKQELPDACLASDIDFVLYDKTNEKILAIIDVKKDKDRVTPVECGVYNDLLNKGYSVYIIIGDPIKHTLDTFHVFEYNETPIVYPRKLPNLRKVSDNFIDWEIKLRGWEKYFSHLKTVKADRL